MDTNEVEWKLEPAMHCSQGATPNCLSMHHLGGEVAVLPSAIVWCDNMAVVSIMASQTSKDSLIMHLLCIFSRHYTTSRCGPSTYQWPAIPLLMHFLAII